jgi:hypothetical protein
MTTIIILILAAAVVVLFVALKFSQNQHRYYHPQDQYWQHDPYHPYGHRPPYGGGPYPPPHHPPYPPQYPDYHHPYHGPQQQAGPHGRHEEYEQQSSGMGGTIIAILFLALVFYFLGPGLHWLNQ